ncbi:MAG: hypothetical protein EAZ36_02855 [Verrucomicrobia bacterium]|nr:MAG: hypothetical protein EAZ36_02855 [Verrucomicrobiota bacterium]
MAWILSLAFLTLLSGCQSFDSRAKEKAAVFASLDEVTKARLAERRIQVGDTTDMVYIALGKPTESTSTIAIGGRTTTWTYSIFWQQYEGTRLVGYRRDVVYDTVSKSYRVVYTPDYQPIYTPRSEDRLRITFLNNRVSVVEQAQADSTPQNSALR